MPNFIATPLQLPNLQNLWFANGVPSAVTDGYWNRGDFLWIVPTLSTDAVPSTLGIFWQCTASGAPGTWQVVPESNQQATTFGGAVSGAILGTFLDEGNLYRNVGNPIAGNGADATDDILGGIQLPAGCFDQAGRGLCITAQGTTGANTNNKLFKVFLNPTLSAGAVINSTTGVISGGTVTAGTPVLTSGNWVNGTTPNNAAGWAAIVQLFKYGAKGSNTQYAQGSPILGTLHGGISATAFLTLTESAAINIVVTGASYTSSNANDVVLQFLEVNAMN